MIQDDNDEYVFRQQFAVDAEAGLLAVPTSSELAQSEAGESKAANGLAFNESYNWTFSIYCDENRPSASVNLDNVGQSGNTLVTSEGDIAFRFHITNTAYSPSVVCISL